MNQRGDLTLVPPATLKLNLGAARGRDSPGAAGPRPTDARADGASLPVEAGKGPRRQRLLVGGPRKGGRGDRRASPRTRSSGPAKEDPESETGVFTRVSGLLRELADGMVVG